MLGVLTGIAYSASTHELYAGQVHNKIGWITTLVAAGLSIVQIARGAANLFRPSTVEDAPLTFAGRLKALLLNTANSHARAGHADYELVDRQQDHAEDPAYPSPVMADVNMRHPRLSATHRWLSEPRDGQVSPAVLSSDDTLHEEPLYASDSDRDRGTTSPAFEHGAQQNPPRARGEPLTPFYGLPASQAKVSRARSLTTRDVTAGFAKYGEAFGWRILIFLGWSSSLTGIVVYTGTCRAEADYRVSRMISADTLESKSDDCH